MSNSNSQRFVGLFVALILLAMAVMPVSVHAAGPWYVATTGADGNDCLSPSNPCATIDGALGKASPGDTINIALGTYASGALLDKSITLLGGWDNSFATVSGSSVLNSGIRIDNGVVAFIAHFTVQNGGPGILNIGGTVTVNNSIIQGNTGVGGAGGGIFNGGLLTVNNSLISNNTTFGSGGGIYNPNTNTTVIVNNSAIINNTGIYGGGIFAGAGTVILNNTSLSGNIASAEGGGIKTAGDGIVIVNNSTVTGNRASIVGGGVAGGGGFSIIRLSNTIVAGNTSPSFGSDCTGPIASAGHNIISDTSNCFFTPETGDLTGVNPLLGPLQDNGGSTLTHALLPGSPAIDVGNPAGCTDQNGNLLTTDQRGVTRPQGPRCDIGAFEFESGNGGISVSIDIVPGSATNIINLRSTSVPVAILSSGGFNASTDVNRSSLTFGKTGNEASFISCLKSGQDVNLDGRVDLICNFRISLTGLVAGDTVAILKGSTVAGIPFEASDLVTVIKGPK